MKTKSQLLKKMEEFFEKMTSHINPVKYLHCDNTVEHQSKLQGACEKERVALEYTTPHTSHLNGVIERILFLVK